MVEKNAKKRVFDCLKNVRIALVIEYLCYM